MSQFDSERVIQNIVSELVQECTRRRHVLTETLVAFMVKAVMLDPTNGFDVDRKLTEPEMEKLKELCLEKLLAPFSPSRDSINMQLYFLMNYTSQRDFLKEIHVGLDSRLSLLSRQITDSRVETSRASEAVYSRILTYILLQSSMGSPTDADSKQEAEAALQRIFPQSELRSFMMLPKKKKEEQLRKLATISTGIRLFNKGNQNREGEFDVRELIPTVLKDALSSARETIRKELSETQTLAWKFTAVLEKQTQCNSQSRLRKDAVILLQQALYNVRTHEGFLKILLTDACACEKVVELLQADLLSQLKILGETLKPSGAAPAARVISSFKALSSTWSRLLDEAELLNFLHKITVNLHPFMASQAEAFSETELDGLQEAAEVKSDEQRLAESSGEQIDPAQAESREWLVPEAASNCSELPLQYNGFCGYTLVNSDGLLLPGNPHIGVLKHEGKLYAFSSKEAALNFASSPDAFAAEVVEKAKRSPELVHLLNLHQQLSWISPFSEVKREEVLLTKTFKCDSGTQTDTHPTETNIDKSYEWNEWELRRKALKLVNLRTKATHSCQTDKSHMRRENVTQTWLQKDAACQSKKDSGSSAATPHIYLAGLTGQREAQVVKVNLSKPPYEE
uniref:Cilia- and flagella-associated protein 206 n=1 Tax=Oryzias latipes TaxID=8090 RepID=A0A3P9II65_ORYLA